MKIEKVNCVNGELILPGDKSISHRAIIFASLAKGKSLINNFLQSQDIYSTINCFRNLGCQIIENSNSLEIEGRGFGKLMAPNNYLDCGNSGTTTRLISGILAAQDFDSILIGDDSLSSRPMKRIIEPLNMMGAKIESNNDNRLPMKIFGNKNLNSVEYELPVASAQVKSCIILAGLHLNEETIVVEKFITRDHTERMLNLEVDFIGSKKIIKASRKNYPIARKYEIPSDISSAAFFIVLALCSKSSELIIRNVSLNPTRAGIIQILKAMGGDIEIINQNNFAGEELGDIKVRSSQLHNVKIESMVISNIIDEIPILSVAGFFAEGKFEIDHAEELRYKESDRIMAVCENLRLLGCKIHETKDGFIIEEKKIVGNIQFKSFNDHRIAMAFYILGALLETDVYMDSMDSVRISNPNFYSQVKSLIN